MSWSRCDGLQRSERILDENSILDLRSYFESHCLEHVIFAAFSQYVAAGELVLKEETIVDARDIAAPGLIKNCDKACDPEIHLTQKN